MSAASKAREKRFNDYLDAVNDGIAAHQRRAPFRLIWRTYLRRYEQRDLGVAVYKNVPEHPYDYFTVRLTAQGLELAEHGKTEQVEREWLMADVHLEHVLAHPERYKRNPVRLQLDWLRTRLGTEARVRTEALRSRAVDVFGDGTPVDQTDGDAERAATEA